MFWGLVAGVVAGMLAAVVVAVATQGPRSEPAAGRNAAPAYLAAWRRSRLGTWRVVLAWERRAGGGSLKDQIRIAQRPPDRLEVAAGNVDAQRDGRRLACAADANGRLRCRDGGPAPSYPEEVDRQEAILRGQVTGPRALYDVRTSGPGCFRLRLEAPSFPAPPYGQRARFCFDARTGAPTLLELDRREGQDRQVATEVSGEVSDGDLVPPTGQSS